MNNNNNNNINKTKYVPFFNLDAKWLNWFVGFCDAECNFQVYPKKRTLKSGDVSKYNVGYGFHLALHKKDLGIIESVYNKLGKIGTINISPSKDEARLAVNDRASLILLCSLFSNISLKTYSQLSRFNFFKESLDNDIKEFKTLELYNQYKSELMLTITSRCQTNSKPNLSLVDNEGLDNWIVGFINGEGCFYTRNGKCNFNIEHTDKNALDLIKTRLSFGPIVSARSIRTKDTGGERKATYQLTISSKKDISCLIEFLESSSVLPLQGNKYNQYVEWKKSIC